MTTRFALTRTTTPTPDADRARMLADPGFGRYFTDHMARASWSTEYGWSDERICGLEHYTLHPASAVLHYGQEIFEGVKAFRHEDGRIALFRPEKNARRMVKSAERLCLPALPGDQFIDSLESLIRADRDWVPDSFSGGSMYLRPFMFASEPFLGVRPAHAVEYGVVASPAGPYFARGARGVSLWITTQFTRAARGGTGAAKCGGNYASSLAAQVEAAQNDCDQVLFTGDSDQGPLVEESGTMNVFIVTDDGRLLTPRLGTILDGVTRDSVLELAVDHGLRAQETSVPLNDLLASCRQGRVTEMFAAGTAAVITPIVRLRGHDVDVTVGDGAPGTIAEEIRQHLVGIQTGAEPDRRDWLRWVD